MTRTIDTGRSRDPRADLEELVAAIAEELGPSFEGGLPRQTKDALARIKGRRIARTA